MNFESGIKNCIILLLIIGKHTEICTITVHNNLNLNNIHALVNSLQIKNET